MMNGQSLNFLKLNIKWFTAGIILLLLGYIVMGWTSATASSFEAKIYAWHKVTLAPVLLLSGYLLIGISIMVRSKK
jgi:hypothetical protein